MRIAALYALLHGQLSAAFSSQDYPESVQFPKVRKQLRRSPRTPVGRGALPTTRPWRRKDLDIDAERHYSRSPMTEIREASWSDGGSEACLGTVSR